MKQKHYLIPDHVLKFKCSMCGECCDKWWKIELDLQSMEKLKERAGKDKAFADEMKSAVKINKDGTGFFIPKYAREKDCPSCSSSTAEGKRVHSNMKCSFLMEDRRCSIHGRFGEAVLPYVCKTYPRKVALTGRGYEISLLFSCESAAQLLTQKQAIEFHQNPEGFDFVDIYGGPYITIPDPQQLFASDKGNYFEIEEVLIDIMQLNALSIEARMAFVGMAVEKVKNGGIPSLQKYLDSIDTGTLQQYEDLPSKPGFMINILESMINERIGLDLSGRVMKVIIDFLFGGVNIVCEEKTLDGKVDKFIEGYNRYYGSYRKDIDHIYENYFVNFVFAKNFYTYRYLDAYFLMVLFFAMIRFFVVCRCMALGKCVDENIVVCAIKEIDSFIGHSPTFYEGFMRKFKQSGQCSLPYILSMVNI